MSEIQYRLGNYREGLSRGRVGQRFAKEAGSFPLEADCLRVQALSCVALDDFARGVVLCSEAIKLLTACCLGGSDSDLQIMNLEAEIHFQKTEYHESRKIHFACAKITSEEWNPLERAYAFVNIATIDIVVGAEEKGIRQTLDVARRLFTINAYPRGISNCDVVLADLLFREGQRDEAYAFYQRCLTVSRGKDAEIPLLCWEKLGDIAYANGDVTTAFRHWMAYFAFTQKTRKMAATHQALRCLGDIFLAEGDDEIALSVFQVALDSFTMMDIHRGRGDCKLRIGDVMKRRAGVARAVDRSKITIRAIFADRGCCEVRSKVETSES